MTTEPTTPATDGRPAETLAPFPGTDAEMFIQWKGTTVCLDFYCACGAHGHFDGDFAYAVRCPSCSAVYELGTQVLARRVDTTTKTPRELGVAPTCPACGPDQELTRTADGWFCAGQDACTGYFTFADLAMEDPKC